MPWQKGQIFFVDPPGIISGQTDRQTGKDKRTSNR